MMSRATSWLGTRTAMLSRPAVASSATAQPARFFSTSVSGPGQNFAASRLAAASNTASRSAASEVGHMGDQRVERGAALGGVEPRDRLAVGRVGAEPVDRLGRERHQPAGGKARGCVGDGADLRRDHPRRDSGGGVGAHVGWLMGVRPAAMIRAACRAFRPL